MSWQVIKNNWSTTTIEDQHGNTVCTLSIEYEATEDNQAELENDMARTATLIKAAPYLIEVLNGIATASPDKWDVSIKSFNDEFRTWAQSISKHALAKARGGL